MPFMCVQNMFSNFLNDKDIELGYGSQVRRIRAEDLAWSVQRAEAGLPLPGGNQPPSPSRAAPACATHACERQGSWRVLWAPLTHGRAALMAWPEGIHGSGLSSGSLAGTARGSGSRPADREAVLATSANLRPGHKAHENSVRGNEIQGKRGAVPPVPSPAWFFSMLFFLVLMTHIHQRLMSALTQMWEFRGSRASARRLEQAWTCGLPALQKPGERSRGHV